MCAIAFRKISTRQDGNISGNMKEFLLETIRSFKADFATAMERLNYNFKS